MMDRELLRPIDVAPLLGVTRRRVYQLLDAGEVPSVKLGRRHYVPRSAWDTWIGELSAQALESVRHGHARGAGDAIQ
jgi:excisionase family DNA binding protein